MTCGVAWALEEPVSEEDRDMGITHRCVISRPAHKVHRCHCGELFTEPEREPT